MLVQTDCWECLDVIGTGKNQIGDEIYTFSSLGTNLVQQRLLVIEFRITHGLSRIVVPAYADAEFISLNALGYTLLLLLWIQQNVSRTLKQEIQQPMNSCTYSSLRHCYVLFSILSSSKAATLPALVSTNANLNFITPTGTNLSDMLPDLPTKDFQYTALYRGPVLPDVACMMVCVFAMRELALLPDFGARYSGKTWIMDDYPQVAMSVGNPGDATTVRWAMWTITAAIKDMMTHNRFQASQFNGIYLDIRVGAVNFFAPNTIETGIVANHTEHAVPQISGAASTTNHSTATVSISFDVSDLKRNATSNADEMWANLTYRTKEISRIDMFMAIIWTLLNVAPHKDNESVRIITIPIAAITASVKISFTRVAGIPPRLQPLQYGNVVSLMAKLPEVLLRENMFREMDIVVKEEGVVVGKGTVRSTALSGFVGAHLTANVSVS